MTDQNPLNGGGQFIQELRGNVVRVTEMRLLKRFVDNIAISGDIGLAAEHIGYVLRRSKLALGTKQTPQQVMVVQCILTEGLVCYGRCFLASTGRRRLIERHVKQLGGDVSLHKELMQRRNDVVAHRAQVHRMTQVFAVLDESGNKAVKDFAFVESIYPFPSSTKVTQYQPHLETIRAAFKQGSDGGERRSHQCAQCSQPRCRAAL